MPESTSDDLLAAYRIAVLEEQQAWDAFQAADHACKEAKARHARANEKFRTLEHDFLQRVRREAGLEEFDPLRYMQTAR